MEIRLEKIQACTGFEPMTSAIPVQNRCVMSLSAVQIYDFHIYLTRVVFITALKLENEEGNPNFLFYVLD